MKNKFILLCFSFMLIFLFACGKQEAVNESDVQETEQDSQVPEETTQLAQTSDTEINSSSEASDNTQEDTASNQSSASTTKSIIVSSSDYEYVLSYITAIHDEECTINNIFGFNLPSENWHLSGYRGFNYDDPWNTWSGFSTYGKYIFQELGDNPYAEYEEDWKLYNRKRIEEELADSQINCYQSLNFVNNEANDQTDCYLTISLAIDHEIDTGEDEEINDISYLKGFLNTDRFPKNASIDSMYSEYELHTLEKEEVLDTDYGSAQIIYQVTSHKLDAYDNTYYDSEREIVLLHLTDFNDLVFFDDTTNIAHPVNSYDVLIEYRYPLTEQAGGYQHILVDMLPQILGNH